MNGLSAIARRTAGPERRQELQVWCGLPPLPPAGETFGLARKVLKRQLEGLESAGETRGAGQAIGGRRRSGDGGGKARCPSCPYGCNRGIGWGEVTDARDKPDGFHGPYRLETFPRIKELERGRPAAPDALGRGLCRHRTRRSKLHHKAAGGNDYQAPHGGFGRAEHPQHGAVDRTRKPYHRGRACQLQHGEKVRNDAVERFAVAFNKLEIAAPKPADEMRARHRLPTGAPLITLFGGGIEPLRVRRMIIMLLQSATPATLVVVAGRSEPLTDALADLSDGPRVQLRVLGRINFVDDLVAASDLVITKSGGLIVSEVLARGTPMVIIDPIPGQEEWNADFVAGTGAGIQLRQPEAVPPAALYLLSQPERLAIMREQARRFGRPRAALDIAERVLTDLNSAA